MTADLAAMATEVTENKNKSTKATGLEEQAKLDAKQKPDMQNILTVSDDNNDEIETLELSQQKKSWWSPWLKTQPSPISLATPGGQEGTLVPPAHHTPSNQSGNLKQLEADIMDLQQNLSTLEVNFKNQKNIIDALSDNHIQCNEIKQELETTITQKVNSLNMDQQFTDLISTTQGLEEKVTKTIKNNTTLETRMKNLEKLQIFISDSFETLEQDMAKNTYKTKDQYDKEDIDNQHQQLQTSITQTHNHIKSLEQQTKKICTKIIADAKTEDRILDQKITETINNNTNLERRMKNLEQNQNKTMTAKKDMADSSTTTGTQHSVQTLDILVFYPLLDILFTKQLSSE